MKKFLLTALVALSAFTTAAQAADLPLRATVHLDAGYSNYSISAPEGISQAEVDKLVSFAGVKSGYHFGLSANAAYYLTQVDQLKLGLGGQLFFDRYKFGRKFNGVDLVNAFPELTGGPLNGSSNGNVSSNGGSSSAAGNGSAVNNFANALANSVLSNITGETEYTLYTASAGLYALATYQLPELALNAGLGLGVVKGLSASSKFTFMQQSKTEDTPVGQGLSFYVRPELSVDYANFTVGAFFKYDFDLGKKEATNASANVSANQAAPQPAPQPGPQAGGSGNSSAAPGSASANAQVDDNPFTKLDNVKASLWSVGVSLGVKF